MTKSSEWQCLDCPLMIAATSPKTPALVGDAVRKRLQMVMIDAPLRDSSFDDRAKYILSEIDEAYLRSVVR